MEEAIKRKERQDMKVMTNGKINEGNVKKKGRRLYKGENKE
jgi:hypothetical protein